MASSGWQDEQLWFTYNSNVRLIGNIRVDSITHSGTNLRVQGLIAGGARGTNGYGFYYLDYTSYAQPESGSKIALGSKGRWWRVGEDDTHVSFDVTLSGVSPSTTSRSFDVNFYGPNSNSVVATLRWNLSFDASGDPPSGGYVTYNSSTDTSIDVTAGVTSWGGLQGKFECDVVTGIANGDAANVTSSNWYHYGRRRITTDYVSTNTLTHDFSITDSSSEAVDSPLNMKGLLHYKLAYWHNNVAGESQGLDDTLRYLPPSISKFTYTDPGGEGSKTYPVVFTGDATLNHTTYDTSSLKRTVRYKIDDGNWTYAANNTQALIGANTSFNVTVPAGKSAVIEGWQTYHGMQSAVKTLTLYNGNEPSRVYGSVNGQSKLLYKMYGSVNGEAKQIVKLYASVNGEAKAILG